MKSAFRRLSKSVVFSLLLFAGTHLSSQSLDFLTVQMAPELSIPVGDSSELWNVGGGGETQIHFVFPGTIPVLSKFQPFISGGFRIFPNVAEKSLSLTTVGLGVEFQDFPAPRFGFGVSLSGGVYSGNYDGQDSPNLYFRGGADVKFRVSPAFALSLGPSYHYFASQDQPLESGIGVQVGVQLNLGGLQGGNKLQKDKLHIDPVFPVLYSQYDKNRMGEIEFTNEEDGDIQNVKVSFFVKQFMERPKQSAVVPEIARGASFTTPLYALFTSDVLKLIESTKVLAEVTVDYDFLGEPRSVHFDEPLLINNRNAMTWDDNRKASTFVSSKDPAVLRYSKYVAGIMRSNAVAAGLNQNLGFGLGLFECLKLMGVNYVVDPTTPYAEFSNSTDAVDFLQFPFETLTYKGGDCDDLSILYASVLQSVGIQTAFVTVPGHIYVAFSLGITEREARSTFPNMNDLIVWDNTVWIPVEITLLQDSFVKAWTVGAQEWREALITGEGTMYPMDSSWQVYDPVSPPDQDTRITLPATNEVKDTVSKGLDKFVSLVLPAKLDSLNKELAASSDKAQILNKIGIVYARYGKYKEANDSFQAALKAGFMLAETNIGNIAYLKNDYSGAKNSYEHSLRANPTDVPTLLGLALTLYETTKYDEAASVFDRIEFLNPSLAAKYAFLKSKKSTGGQ